MMGSSESTPGLPVGFPVIVDEDLDEAPLPSLEEIERDTARLNTLRASLEDPAPHFERIKDGYRLVVPEIVGAFEVTGLHRARGQLSGVITVRSEIKGARTFCGVLLPPDLVSLQSSRSRAGIAKDLDHRAGTKDSVDWRGLLDRLCIEVTDAEARGPESRLISDYPRPTPDDTFEVLGLPLLSKHPMILFGDGGTMKSYFSLFILGELARKGMRVALFDWEMGGETQRERLEALYGADMPPIHYESCASPLVSEAPRLRRMVQEKALDFAVFDSIAFASDGPPEAAEVAARYAQAYRSLELPGSLQIAHVTKNGDGSDQKPFGSAFWHNFGRSTWNVKRSAGIGDRAVSLALHHRKANLGPLRPSMGFEISFDGDRSRVQRIDPSAVPELAEGLSTPERIWGVLRNPKTRNEIVTATGCDPDDVRVTLWRDSKKKKPRFVELSDGRISRLESVHV